MESLDGGERDSIRVYSSDVFVVSADFECRGEILRHGSDVCRGDVVGVMPAGDGQSSDFFENRF